MKDILVDNNVAKNFCNPMDENYKDFILWLRTNGALVVCQKLLVEYYRTCCTSNSDTNVCVLIAELQSDGRLNKINKAQLSAFKIPKAVRKILPLHDKDIELLKTTLLSQRRLAITIEKNLRDSINMYPRFKALAVSRPECLKYR